MLPCLGLCIQLQYLCRHSQALTARFNDGLCSHHLTQPLNYCCQAGLHKSACAMFLHAGTRRLYQLLLFPHTKVSKLHLGSVQFGVWIAYALVAYCYFGVGFAGYHAFGSATGSQIMYSLGHPIWVVCVAEIMIIVHVCGSFQVCCCGLAVMRRYLSDLSQAVGAARLRFRV